LDIKPVSFHVNPINFPRPHGARVVAKLDKRGMAGRVLGVDDALSDQWAPKSATRPIAVIDGLLTAMALANGLILVTRNDHEVAGFDATVLNLFKGTAATFNLDIGTPN
jgi:predicted nucleic acid-binding protein